MTSKRCWVSSFVMFALAAIPLENPVQASLPPLTNIIPDTTLCQEGCTCDSIYQLAMCANLELLSIPYNTVRNNTRVLRLPGNNISSLNRDTLRRFRQLRLLDLADNQITRIAEDTFESQAKVMQLDLSGNRLSRLPVMALAQLKSLRTLYLERNNITFLSTESFANLTKLQNLSLSSNGLQVIDAGAFVEMVSLRALNLDSNFLREIPAGSLSDCSRLEHLSVSANSMGTFVNNSEALGEFSARSWFEPMEPSRLRTLRLSNNFIDMFSPLCFSGMTELTELDLSSNYILEIPRDLFQDLKLLETLKLSKNSPLNAISSGVFRNTVNLLRLKVRNGQLTHLSADLFCNTTQLEILDLTGNGLSDTRFISAVCLRSLVRLFLGNNAIAKIPNDGLSGLSALEVLDLSGNLLTHMPNINSLEALETLDISNNYLESLGNHAFSGTSIKYLDLSSNHLQLIKESTMFSLLNCSTVEIKFDDNPWACDCRFEWATKTKYKGFFLADYVECAWPPEFRAFPTLMIGVENGVQLKCSSYPKRENLYLLIGTWFGVVIALMLVFWAAAFLHARRRFRARQPRERFLLFKNPNDNNEGTACTATGHFKVRFKALDSETESLEDDETTV